MWEPNDTGKITLMNSEEPSSHQGKPNEIVVFIVRRNTECGECRRPLLDGEFLRLDQDRPLCLDCADLGHLEFLPRGNTALTRRATKYSALRAVVVRWARARKRYERQGILVTPDAIEKAESECLADEDRRARQRERAAERRDAEDKHFITDFADAVLKIFPGCAKADAARIATHACRKYSGRVGRSAAAKELDPQAIALAVTAHVRHEHTNYDELLMRHGDRTAARLAVREKIQTTLDRWRRQ